jgi:hypothetical protein
MSEPENAQEVHDDAPDKRFIRLEFPKGATPEEIAAFIRRPVREHGAAE